MKDNLIAFEDHKGDLSSFKRFRETSGHLVFDLKLGENFRHKVRVCADNHKTDAPPSVIYSNIDFLDFVCIILLVKALNKLKVMCGDVQNAYLTTPNREKL